MTSPDARNVIYWPHWRDQPYLGDLHHALAMHGVEAQPASVWRVVNGSADALHVHWPEAAVAAPERLYTCRTALQLGLLVLLARTRRTPIVVTLHNLRSHENLRPRLEHRWTSWILKRAKAVVVLSEGQIGRAIDAFPKLERKQITVVPHFDWRHRFSAVDRSAARSALGVSSAHRLFVFAGLVRPYKGVHELLTAFGDLDDQDSRLIVMGRRSPPDSQSELVRAAAQDSRVQFNDRAFSDAELADALSAADFAVFPFLSVENSGSVLAALSLDCPVVVPALPALIELARSYGPDWVRLYDPPLTGQILGALSQGRDAEARWVSKCGVDEAAEEMAALYAMLSKTSHRGSPA